MVRLVLISPITNSYIERFSQASEPTPCALGVCNKPRHTTSILKFFLQTPEHQGLGTSHPAESLSLGIRNSPPGASMTEVDRRSRRGAWVRSKSSPDQPFPGSVEVQIVAHGPETRWVGRKGRGTPVAAAPAGEFRLDPPSARRFEEYSCSEFRLRWCS